MPPANRKSEARRQADLQNDRYGSKAGMGGGAGSGMSASVLAAMARSMSIQPPAVLFVCLGNICRSPLAEAAFRARADAAGLIAIADSAGTGGWHVGEPPDLRAQATARRYGIDIAGFRARQVAAGDFNTFTHIFALDDSNLAHLRQIAPPRASAQLGLLLDLVKGSEGQSVADPYYGGAEGFEKTWRQVDAAAAALVNLLRG
jgi:protein-tyrosine phosphatase